MEKPFPPGQRTGTNEAQIDLMLYKYEDDPVIMAKWASARQSHRAHCGEAAGATHSHPLNKTTKHT